MKKPHKMADLKSVQTEIDASFLYKRLAEKEEDKTVADIFRQMSEIKNEQEQAFLKKQNKNICRKMLKAA